jgi:hypothetical protein
MRNMSRREEEVMRPMDLGTEVGRRKENGMRNG